MSKTITVPDEVYEQLEKLADTHGAANVECLLAQLWDDELRRRREVGRRIDELRQRIFDKYGYLGDSVELIREDRER
jgi:hypothetical protein